MCYVNFDDSTLHGRSDDEHKADGALQAISVQLAPMGASKQSAPPRGGDGAGVGIASRSASPSPATTPTGL